MLSVWKYQIKIILVVITVDLVVSCLVTNCPRGGKRGRSDPYIPNNNLIDLRSKKCQLCGPDKGYCPDILFFKFLDLCFLNHSCTDEGQCVDKEDCCSKGFCKTHKLCKVDFPHQILRELKQSSMLLKKLLDYTLNHSE